MLKNFLNEFKEFAMKGNVMDMAIGVVIGAAFGKIVTSLVDNIIMPLVGIITGGNNFASLHATVGDAILPYGIVIQDIVDFLIVAFCIFLVVKAINKLKKDKPAEPEPAPEPTAEEKLLSEIRDLLKNK